MPEALSNAFKDSGWRFASWGSYTYIIGSDDTVIERNVQGYDTAISSGSWTMSAGG